MNQHVREIGGLLACAIGALMVAHALFGHGWLVGESRGLDVRGGIIDVHYCSKADDPDPLPMGIGDHEGCMSEMYTQSELRRQAGSWFGTGTHMTLFFGASAAGLFLLFALIAGFAFEIEVVSRRQQLAMHLFDVQGGAILLHTHPGVGATRLGVMAGVALTIAVASAPASLSVGPDLVKFVAGLLLASAGAIANEPHRFLPGSAAAALVSPDPEPADDASAAASEPIPEGEVEESDDPSCVKCQGNTLWLEKAGRHRCQKCGLYQPLHPPGSQVGP